MLIMLRDNSMTTKDFDESVHKVFKYSTCPDFVKLVEHIALNMRFGIKKYETTEYLAILKEEHSTKISAGTWPAKSTKNCAEPKRFWRKSLTSGKSRRMIS